MKRLMFSLVLVLLLTSCNNEKTTEETPKEEKPISQVNFLDYQMPEDHIFKQLDTLQYRDLAAKNESFYLIIGSPT